MSACVVCGRDMVAARANRRTCSDACRMALSRRRHGVTEEASGANGLPAPPVTDNWPEEAPRLATVPARITALAATIATPSEPGWGPCRAYCGIPRLGPRTGQELVRWQVYFATHSGLGRTYVGPELDAGDAALLARALNARL